MAEILTDKWYFYPPIQTLFLWDKLISEVQTNQKKSMKTYQDQANFILPVSLFESHICRP